MPSSHEPDFKRKIQLLLQQLDQLPTLSSIAVRLLEATTSQDTSACDVVELVSADPSLSSKVLGLCRKSSRGINLKDASIQKAVVLLGFDEVRSTALSVEVFELMQGVSKHGGESHSEEQMFDRAMFWRHCFAVAIVAEHLVRKSKYRKTVSPGEAFLAGLLHDLGQLALHTVLPKTFDRVCEVAEAHGIEIDRVCHRVIGQSSSLFGKHLAEHWQLPESLVTAIWLNGQPPETLPECINCDLVNIVTLADVIVRRQLITHPGHGPTAEHIEKKYIEQLGITESLIAEATENLHDEVSDRAETLGLGQVTSQQLLKSSIESANRLMKRLQKTKKTQTAAARTGSKLAAASATFFQRATPGASVTTALTAIAESMATLLGSETPLTIYLSPNHRMAELFQFDASAQLITTRTVDLSNDAVEIWQEHHDEQQRQIALANTTRDSDQEDELDPLIECILAQTDFDNPRLLTLECGPETSAAIIFEGEFNGAVNEVSLDILRCMWGSAVAAASSKERTANLSERLVESNRTLIEAQMSLAEKRAMASIGELASGAAHEMNNPLTVISGRAQLLARKLTSSQMKNAAEEIAHQTQIVSDLITALRMSADMTEASPTTATAGELVSNIRTAAKNSIDPNIALHFDVDASLPSIHLDHEQLTAAMIELIRNAHEAGPGHEIRVQGRMDELDGRLIFRIIDSGPGLDEQVLAHAFDPFFSKKPAGRQTGLGLSRARKLIEANNGELTLENATKLGLEHGAVATIMLDSWQAAGATTGGIDLGLRDVA